MKKIFLTATFMIAFSLIGVSQSIEKALHNGKWYANAELGSNKITLSKTAATSNAFDLQLMSETAIQFGKTAAADFVNDEGGKVKAGTYYTELGYAYKLNGNSFSIHFAPKEWNYNVTPQKNGDLLLELAKPANKSTK